METYTLSQFSAPYSIIHISLFRNVVNAPEIRKRLVAASTMVGIEGDQARAAVDFGFIEGRLIVSREHLMTTIISTLLTTLSDTTTTPIAPKPHTRSHNLHSELLLSLSPNNNISDSIRRHGMSDNTDYLITVRIGGTGSEEEVQAVWKGMEEVVKGELISLDQLDRGDEVDWSRIDKIYKLSELNHLALSSSEIRQKKIAAVINTIAVKSVT